MTTEIDSQRVRQIFFPYATAATDRVKSNGGRFVYYTTADVAARILTNKQIWMRNTMTMNDYMEVDHGLECLRSAFQSEPGKAFDAALNACFPLLAEEIKDLFDTWVPYIRRDTFITCVSEHSADEDNLGRLSMWRAYGGRTGVALVLNGGVMFRESDALGAYASPVAYMNSVDFGDQFTQVAEAIHSEVEFVRILDREGLKNTVFNVLRFAALCTKHPGFREEREWRIVASPDMHPSHLLPKEVEVVRGTPQTVLKINLKNHPEKNLIGLTLPELLNRIIIGPCEFPDVMRRAFDQLLVDAGVPEPEQKIAVSDIPLRHA